MNRETFRSLWRQLTTFEWADAVVVTVVAITTLLYLVARDLSQR